MPDLMRRTFQLQLAAAEGAGRIVEGRCVPYGVETMVADAGTDPYREVFLPGAFQRAVKAPTRVSFRFRHGDALADWIGRGLEFTEDDDGLTGSLRVTESAFGDHALALIDDGIIRGLSVGFLDLARRVQRTASGAIIRARCHLAEVSLVPESAYVGAEVTGRRESVAVASVIPDPYESQRERLRAIGVQV